MPQSGTELLGKQLIRSYELFTIYTMNTAKLGRRFGELAQRILKAARKANQPAPPRHGQFVTSRAATLRWLSTFVDSLADHDYRRYTQTVRRLQQTGLLSLGNQRVTLTIAGEKTLREFEEVASLRTETWDGIWRIVIWDVPEKRRQTRNVMRHHLKELGFIGIQKSVWICPWPCRDYISSLRERLELQRGLLFFETSVVEGSGLLERFFRVSKTQ